MTNWNREHSDRVSLHTRSLCSRFQMYTLLMLLASPKPRFTTAPGLPFAAGFVALAVIAAIVCGLFPVGVSVAAVFLFAGPHNWFEARYILGRLPARTGKLWSFFLVSFFGIVGLTVWFAALPWLYEVPLFGGYTSEVVSAWTSALVLWIATLVWMRSRTAPRFDGSWVWAAACGLVAVAWLVPWVLPVAMVYIHPLIALWLLGRELRRSRRHWLPAYRATLLAMPVLFAGLVFTLWNAEDLPGTDPLTVAITQHSGEKYIPWVSNRLLVTAHTFLELVHYGVWVVLMPLVGLKSAPWDTTAIPAARRGGNWKRGVIALLAFGLLVTGVLWVAFLTDYTTTRSVYFTVALLHVLAEAPFLLRML